MLRSVASGKRHAVENQQLVGGQTRRVGLVYHGGERAEHEIVQAGVEVNRDPNPDALGR
jgi:hypothetical protein